MIPSLRSSHFFEFASPGQSIDMPTRFGAELILITNVTNIDWQGRA
ncbi:MAG: hypothetical protein P8176_12610 [Gammaproteobacteria bacterium]